MLRNKKNQSLYSHFFPSKWYYLKLITNFMYQSFGNFQNQKLQLWPGGSVGWSVVPHTKGFWAQSLVRAITEVTGSIPSQGAYLCCGVQSLVRACMGRWEATNQCFSHVDVYATPSLLFSKINKHILE